MQHIKAVWCLGAVANLPKHLTYRGIYPWIGMEPRIIKKYPNRRLYDTERSCYITVDDVRALVVGGVPFKVVDAQSEDDITRGILIQIITEHESGQKATFTTDMLARFIRLSHDAAQDAFAHYLDQTMRVYLDQQQTVQEQMKEALTGKVLSGIAEQNLKIWRDLQENFLKAAGFGGNPPTGKGGKEPK